MIAFQPTNSHPPGATAGSAVGLHNRPNGSRPGSTQFDLRRSMVLTVRSEILSIALVIHGKMYPATDSSNHPMDTPADKVVGLRTAVRSSVPFAKRGYYRSPLDYTPNSRCVLGLGWHLIRAG